MNRGKVIGFAIGPIGAGALAFITLPVMTWVFTPEVVGMLSMLQVVINLATVLFSLGLDQAYVREFHESEDRPRLLRSVTLPGLLLLIGLATIVTIFWPKALSSGLFGVGSIAYGVIVAICLVTAFISRFLSLILRMQERGLAYSMSQLLARLLLLLLVATIAVLPTPKTFMLLLMAQFAALLTTLTVFAWNTRKDWVPALSAHIERLEMVRLFHFGWPLVFGGVASWALMAMDRVFLRSMSTYEELAVYSVAASIAAGVTIFAGVFNTIWAPVVYKWVAEKGDLGRINNVANHMMVIMFLVMCMTGACSWIVSKFLPAAYANVSYILPGCMVAPLLYTFSEVTGVGILIMRKTGYSLLASLGAAIVNFILNFVLVHKLGATGAMIATAVSFWCYFALKTEMSTKILANKRRWRDHEFAFMLIFLSLLYATIGIRFGLISSVAWLGLMALGVVHGRKRLFELWKLSKGDKAELLTV